jgi:hypothetical protein
MWVRILIASVVGGALVFCVGATNHMVFHLLDRTMRNIPESDTFASDLKSRNLHHGLYVFPNMPTAAEQNDPVKMKEFNLRYAAGPSGLLIIAHPGPMLMGEMIGKELVTNVIAAFIVAWVVSLFGPEVGFGRRWGAVVLMGLLGWINLAASYGIWYRFPHDFLHDELLCTFLEWSVAGLAIAAIVRKKPASITPPATT